jgi:hypothetical protein
VCLCLLSVKKTIWKRFFAPSDATRKLIARIQEGGRVALNQDHDEIEVDIRRLRTGPEASKSHLNDELAPLHCMTGAPPTSEEKSQ